MPSISTKFPKLLHLRSLPWHIWLLYIRLFLRICLNEVQILMLHIIIFILKTTQIRAFPYRGGNMLLFLCLFIVPLDCYAFPCCIHLHVYSV